MHFLIEIMAIIGASTIWLAALAIRDYWKCRRYELESQINKKNN